MSTYANSDDARIWLDGDAFRAAAGTTLPVDPFAATLAGWEAFGGIKAGFVLTRERDVTEVDVWNNTSGAPYKRIKKSPTPTIAMRPVDNSKATALTLLRGGSIAEVGTDSGLFKWTDGDEEEFGLIIRVQDGDNWKAYYMPKCELANIPEENMGADDDVEGWDLEIGPLAPTGGGQAITKYTSYNPLAVVTP